MKFGKSLPRNQVPEWSSNYIDYKGLKKHIKSVTSDQRVAGEADLTPFFFELDRNLETVDSFFNKRFAESQRRLKLLQGRYGEHFDWMTSESGSVKSEDSGETAPDGFGMDSDEMSELLGALLELRSGLRKLQWYGEVNRRGFIKILKKVDKKTNVCAQKRYLESKVILKPFASATEVIAAMQTVNTWLSKVGGTDGAEYDVESSVRPTLRRFASGTAPGAPEGTADKVDLCIREDNSTSLSDALVGEYVTQKLLLILLQRAITNKALACIDLLLGRIETLHEDDDINERNIIHRLVISIGRNKSLIDSSTDLSLLDTPTPGSSLLQTSSNLPLFITPAESPISLPPSSRNTTELDGTLKLSAHDSSVKLLEHLLSKLRPHQRPALAVRDSYGRMALHYAAQYGFVVICQVVIKYMRQWGQFDVSDGIDSPNWQDSDGLAPLHLAVMGAHPKTTKLLLQAESWDGGLGSDDKIVSARKAVSKSSAVLALAAKANATAIVKLLVEAGVDINYQDDNGETALHHAARLGHVECAKVLLEGNDTQRADLELAEKTYGWTPLFVAAVEGKTQIVETLLEAGSELDKIDLSGWTAAEHASLRGHLDIARILAKNISVPEVLPGSVTPSPPSSLEKMISLNGSSGKTTAPIAQPVKSFGHRYLKKGETMILVTLGSTDTRKNMSAVKLDKIPLSEAHSTQLDTALSLVVSAQNATGEPSIIDLPVHTNSASEDPICFETKDASKVKLMFDLVPTYSGAKDRIIGRAVALLSSIKPGLGRSRVALQGDIQVPILAVNSLEIIGCVNFEFRVVTPFEHPNMEVTKKQTYWKSLAPTRVIGHRGLGKNTTTRKSLQLGENTLLSFIAAANLGAEYVEFDVQLTKDHVPVIYHDFLVGETGIDAPVHTMTLDQFMSISEHQNPRHRRTGSPNRPWDSGNSPDTIHEGRQVPPQRLRRTRSMSLNEHDDHHVDSHGRMKHTRGFMKNGFKANVRGSSIQSPFTTLEETFKKLPQSVGFNIELKYPMLQETEEHEMDSFAIEMNHWVDTILKVVYDNVKGRDLIFSSFNPDICLLLSFKQPSIPILFLTDGGTHPMADIRASCVQEAIRFASNWNLLGIVSAAEPLVLCPRLIKVVKESGLVCITYGVLNNDPENVKVQVDQGIDAVIVDSVLAIRKGLTAAGARTTYAAPATTATVEKTEDVPGAVAIPSVNVSSVV
ncbi:GDPD-domain-containing protein [Morchella conica CCBAS932]|uniref:GDPD-domain-containing protein n=1 Tax=Morchella conica CCBAS932 TaxID=1392247 RepID=A0A3N4KIE0_9PEZI|nr:GDPD-domain-containing protein [Morchella conica CCBAS932]